MPLLGTLVHENEPRSRAPLPLKFGGDAQPPG